MISLPKKIHPVGLTGFAIFITLGMLLIIFGEMEARRRQEIIAHEKAKTPAKIESLKERIKNPNLSNEDKEFLLDLIAHYEEYGWSIQSNLLPSNVRYPNFILGVTLIIVGILFVFYKPRGAYYLFR